MAEREEGASLSATGAIAMAETDPENGQLVPSEGVPQPLQVDHCLEKILSRVRSDSVYELRKLRHQHRPVSEFTSKQTLEQLLEKRHLAPPPSAATGPDPEETHSNVEKRVKELSSISQENAATAAPQVHMPAPIRLEIRGLFERQQVTEFLNSPHARDIERTLQDGLERRNRRQQRRRTRPFPSNQRQGRGAGSPLQVRAGGRPMSRRHVSTAQRRLPENGRYPVPQRDQSSIVRQLQQSPALNSLQPAERDRVLTEVGSLVQQQLVTSALSGEFRGVLELHVQNRADQIRDGMTGEDITNSLQRRSDHTTRTYRYDPHSDEPSSASMAEMRQELREMKSQMLELRQLMRTSFDLQLEIQRAIRQEVAAALASACVGPTVSYPSMHPAKGLGIQSESSANIHVIDSGNCVICSEASIDSVVYRCGHMCVCMPCGLELKAQALKCPICRAPITDVIRAYSSMQ